MRFNKAILALPMPWPIWMALLMLANLVCPFFFLGTLEATIVLVGFAASITLMLALFARFGFVRLLGLGHAPWLFTVPWLNPYSLPPEPRFVGSAVLGTLRH